MLAQVSTLFSTVGWPQSPFTLERTYLGLGSPTLALESDVIRAVDSPQTKAPAPLCTLDGEVEARAEDVRAQQAGLLGLL